MTTTQHPARLQTRTKVGLVLGGLLGLTDMAGPFSLRTPAGETGPPTGVLVLDAVLGLVTVVFVVVALRTLSRGAIRIAAGARILSAATALPAFFAGPSAPTVVIAAAAVIVSVIVVVLMLSPAPRAVGAGN